MSDKPHLYKKHGYWNCIWQGFHGASYSKRGAVESMLKTKLFWMRNLNLSCET